ncbi:hypothetical protein [Arthrobacter sp. NPDC057259]|uniref:hypothetical protein n=1 Tax=Arthrobacter sp. NPDC057259 TaxID=3346073 RepID=UPI003638836F
MKDFVTQPSIKRDLVLYGTLLVAPFTFQAGVAALLFEHSQFFAEKGVWKSLSAEQQGTMALQVVAAWAALVTSMALVFTFFLRRWQEIIWLPIGRALRWVRTWIGKKLVGRNELSRLADEEIKDRARKRVESGPPKGRQGRRPLEMVYGEIRTIGNLYDPNLSVEWRNSGVQFGLLTPSPGNLWEVHHGHERYAGIPGFVPVEDLGRVEEEWQGVEKLRQREQRERQRLLKADS